MSSTNTTPSGIMIIPDADDFMSIIASMQEAYDKQHGHTGDGEDEE